MLARNLRWLLRSRLKLIRFVRSLDLVSENNKKMSILFKEKVFI